MLSYENGIAIDNSSESTYVVQMTASGAVDNAHPRMQSNSRTLERFHIYLLLVLGIAFFGAGITVIGFVSSSPAAVGTGAGSVAAAGLISIFLALVAARSSEQKSVSSDASPAASPPPSDPNNLRFAWPLQHRDTSRTSSRSLPELLKRPQD
jgi:hypothetical protein